MRLFPLLLAALVAVPVAAQPALVEAARALVPVDGPLRNAVVTVHAEGDTLWAGPQLVLTADGGRSWQQAVDQDLSDGADAFNPPLAPDPSVFSLDVEGDDVFVGLGFVDRTTPNEPQAGAGVAFSRDGGRTWTYRIPPLDRPTDTLAVYGCDLVGQQCFVYPAQPWVTPAFAAPFDIDYDPTSTPFAPNGTVWVAGWATGLRVSYDLGRRWERVVLPPDTVQRLEPPLAPEDYHPFLVGPEVVEAEEANNYLGFAVLVDEAGAIWYGSVDGVNRSAAEDALVFVTATDTLIHRAWDHVSFTGTTDGLAGAWTTAIEEQPVGDPAFPVGSPQNPRNPVWLASWRAFGADERFGVSVWRGDGPDGRPVFEPTLLGERVYDFGFCTAAMTRCRPGTVYAAGGRGGLFASEDDGRSWRATRDFRDAARPGRSVRRDAQVYGVDLTRDGTLWVGTADGLLRSDDGGQTWAVFRADVPLAGDEPDAAPVDVYAYPNPYSPNADGDVRLVYRASGPARIRIFDFGMNLVRELSDPNPERSATASGAVETAWDGADAGGARVANGVYFWSAEAGEGTQWGKIMVLE